MLKVIFFASFSLLLTTAAQAQTVGSCAWSKVSAEEKQAFLSAYQTGIQNGMAQLNSKDNELRAFVVACANRSDIPRLWMQGIMGSQAIQYGSSSAVASARGISRAELDEAWLNAPATARQCVRANAAKVFGMKDEVCPDPKAPIWFFQALKISPTVESPLGTQMLYYFNAKAQSEWAEALITKFLQTPAKP